MANTTNTKILTTAGLDFLAQMNVEENPFKVDKLIFANIPDRADYPQPEDGVPTDYVVAEKAVERRGRLGPNVVIYTTTLTSAEGPFEFNWTGAYNEEHGVLLAIDHHKLTPKTENSPGITGNTLVRSFSLEYKDIAEITNITVDASTWQYDSTKRLAKMDNDAAQAIIDQNGKDWFIEDGFLVTPYSGSFKVHAGAGYVSGNRVSMDYDSFIQVLEKPSFIYIDASREGSPTGEWKAKYNFVVSADELDDYYDGATNPASPHFVCKIAQAMADGSVRDLRPEGERASREWVLRRFNNYLGKVIDWTPNTQIVKDGRYRYKGKEYLPLKSAFVTRPTFEEDLALGRWEPEEVTSVRNMAYFADANRQLDGSLLREAFKYGGTFLVDDDLELNEHVIAKKTVKIIGSGRIWGKGCISGVISNQTNVDVLDLNTNCIYDTDYNQEIFDADIVVDSIGIDERSVSNVSEAVNAALSLIESGRNDDITVYFRGGYHEVPAGFELPETLISGAGQFNVSMDSAEVILGNSEIIIGQTHSGNIFFKNYPKEKPVFGPRRHYVSCHGSTTYKNHFKVPNDNKKLMAIYRKDMKKIPLSSNYNKITRRLQRWQGESTLLTVDTTQRLKPSNQDLKMLQQEGTENVYMRITHNYTSTWHYNLTLDGDALYYQVNSEAKIHPSYYDGYHYATKRNGTYWLNNLLGYLTPETFACKPDYIYVPKSVKGFFYTESYNGWHIINRATGLIIEGIDLNDFNHPIEALFSAWSAHPANVGVMDMSAAKYCKVRDFETIDNEGAVFKLGKSPTKISNFAMRNIGMYPMTAIGDGTDSAEINDFVIERFGHNCLSAIGVYGTGRNVHMHDGIIRYGSWSAARFDSANYTPDKTDNCGGKIHDVVMYGMGVIDGELDELYLSSDTGIFTTNGRGYMSDYHMWNCYISETAGLATISRCVFFDDGVHGMRMDNVFVGQSYSYHAIDIRQVNDHTYDNVLTNIVCLGSLKQMSLNKDSHFSGVVAGDRYLVNTSSDINEHKFGFSKIGAMAYGIPNKIREQVKGYCYEYTQLDTSVIDCQDI